MLKLYTFGSFTDMVLSDDLMEDKSISRGCKTTRKLIIKHSIPSTEIAYAMFVKSKNCYQVSTNENNKAKVFITNKWVTENLMTKSKPSNEVVDVDVCEVKHVRTLQPIPPLLDLEEHERLKDNQGKYVEIEVRGERTYDKCFFKAKDVANAFKILRLNDVILNKKASGYQKSIHYQYFIADKYLTIHHGQEQSNVEQNGQIEKGDMYLTYLGLVRCLFVSKNPNTERFQEWAIKILFAHQMGTIDQKIDVTSKCLGVSTEALQKVLSKSVDPISCVYVFSLGTVKDLRQAMKIEDKYSDDLKVVKYGRTIDLIRRTKEHEKLYGAIKDVNLELSHFLYVDPDMCVEAENMLKEYFEDSTISYKQTKEIAVINMKEYKHIYDRFLYIKDKCCNKVKILNDHIKKLQEELKTHQQSLDLIHRNHEMELENTQMRMKLDAEIEFSKLRMEKEKLIIENEKKEIKSQMHIEKLEMQLELQARIHALETENLKMKLNS